MVATLPAKTRHKRLQVTQAVCWDPSKTAQLSPPHTLHPSLTCHSKEDTGTVRVTHRVHKQTVAKA